MPRAVIIDTDPGIDDAVAILLAVASPELAVEALVAVAGNLPLAATERNARAILALAGCAEIPVYAGCPRPLGPGGRDAAAEHGEAGLGDLVLPHPATPLRPEHGIFHLIAWLRGAAPGSVTLCALGPLTNIAAALVLAPEIAAAIGELAIMGGGTRGNVTPAAEFNIHCDPEAAAIVFASGLPITLVPLDVTDELRSTPQRLVPIARLGTRCGAAAATLIGPRAALGRPPMPLHDPCVIAWLLEPELFRAGEARVAIETSSPLTRGMTVIDRRAAIPNARVLDAVDADGFWQLLAHRLARLP